jgi:hypothetical protein
MKSRWNTALDLVSVAIDAACVMMGAYMTRELYRDIKQFFKDEGE